MEKGKKFTQLPFLVFLVFHDKLLVSPEWKKKMHYSYLKGSSRPELCLDNGVLLA